MEGEIGLITEAVKAASRFLLRDYYELENLQNSNNSTINFSNKSGQKAMQTLLKGLEKYFQVIFDKELVATHDFQEKTVLVETIDGFSNFSRSIPFFAIMVTLLKKKDDEILADKSVITFPALGEMLYVQRGKGAFMEKYSSNMQGTLRLRVSKTKEIKEAISSFDRASIGISKSLPNFRFYNSYTYSLSQFLSGKIDVICVKNNPISRDGIKLFIEEAGGNMHENDGKMIASNLSLFEAVKNLI